jgi:hypothetical protein
MLKKKVEERKKVSPLEIMRRKRDLNNKVNLADKLTKDLDDMEVKQFKPIEQEGNLNIDSDYLMLPKDLTDEHSKELGKYLNAFTQQKMYMRTLIGWQELFTEEAKRKYFEVSHNVYSELSQNKKMSETAKERHINNLEEVKPIFLDYKDCKRRLDLLQNNLASIEDALFLVSREVSRRESDFGSENRNHNVGRK